MSRAKWVLLALVAVARAGFAGEPAPVESSDEVGFEEAAAGDDGAVALTAWGETLGGCEEIGCDEGGLDCADCTESWRGGGSPVRLRFSVPIWLSEIHGDAVIRGVPATVNVTSRDMLEAINDVNFAVVGRLEADAGRWGLLADGGYVNLSADRGFAGGRINLSQGVESAIVESFLTYDLLEDESDPIGGSAELLAGARYWLLGGDVAVTGPLGNTVRASGTREWVDPVFGARFATPLSESLLLRTRADVGGFGAASDFTWGVEALGEYRCSECCAMQLGYKVLDVDYSRGDFAYDVNYRGPVAALVFDF